MRFERSVGKGGYAWWYIDAISDDGTQALTLIAFIGSVFSPYYVWASRRQPAPAAQHCAMNIALYQRRGGIWAMTERSERALARTAHVLQIGPSQLHWDGTQLTAHIEERAAPLPLRVRGNISLTPLILQPKIFNLDAGARHRWQPIAPQARVEVNFSAPQCAWRGNAYFDSNDGDVPLAQDFASWSWARLGSRIIYDVEYKDGSRREMALSIDDKGQAHSINAPSAQPLPGTFWRMPRSLRADASGDAELLRTLEDAPFYARSLVRTRLHGELLSGVHETLSLRRFSSPLVRAMLPFRMPRLG